MTVSCSATGADANWNTLPLTATYASAAPSLRGRTIACCIQSSLRRPAAASTRPEVSVTARTSGAIRSASFSSSRVTVVSSSSRNAQSAEPPSEWYVSSAALSVGFSASVATWVFSSRARRCSSAESMRCPASSLSATPALTRSRTSIVKLTKTAVSTTAIIISVAMVVRTTKRGGDVRTTVPPPAARTRHGPCVRLRRRCPSRSRRCARAMRSAGVLPPARRRLRRRRPCSGP